MEAKGKQISSLAIIALIIGLVTIALALPAWNTHKGRTQSVGQQCYRIGHDLLAHTNSGYLSSLQPAVQKRLAQFLTAPARVEDVQLGDEPRPAGDPKATARLFLVNDRNEHLGIRLQKEPQGGKFRVLGYWVPETMHMAAKR